MMVLPFVALAVAFCLAWAGRRSAAIALWALSVGLMLLLFRIHATDTLPLAF